MQNGKWQCMNVLHDNQLILLLVKVVLTSTPIYWFEWDIPYLLLSHFQSVQKKLKKYIFYVYIHWCWSVALCSQKFSSSTFLFPDQRCFGFLSVRNRFILALICGCIFYKKACLSATKNTIQTTAKKIIIDRKFYRIYPYPKYFNFNQNILPPELSTEINQPEINIFLLKFNFKYPASCIKTWKILFIFSLDFSLVHIFASNWKDDWLLTADKYFVIINFLLCLH